MCDIFPSFLHKLHFLKSYTVIDDGPTPTKILVHYCKIQLKYLFIQFENSTYITVRKCSSKNFHLLILLHTFSIYIGAK